MVEFIQFFFPIFDFPKPDVLNDALNRFSGVMWCDSMICPERTIKCIASKMTTTDLKHIVRQRKCVAENGKVAGSHPIKSTINSLISFNTGFILKLEDITEPNPYPNYETADYAEALVSGNDIYQCTNCNNPYLKEIYELHRYQANHLTASLVDYKERLQHAIMKFQQDINERILMDLENLFKRTMWMFRKRK